MIKGEGSAASMSCISLCHNKRSSLLKKSTDEFLRMRNTMFCCQYTANRSHMRRYSMFFFFMKLCNRVFQQAAVGCETAVSASHCRTRRLSAPSLLCYTHFVGHLPVQSYKP